MRLKEIAKITRGQLCGDNIEVKYILPPEEANKNCLTFLFNMNLKTLADAVISEKKIANKNCIIVKDCKKAMYYLLKEISDLKKESGIARTAIIEIDIKTLRAVTIGDYTVIRRGAKIGKGCSIGCGVYIAEDVIIGDYCTIEHNVVLNKNTKIGNYVSISANSVIGKEGFGYVKFKRYKHIPHIGSVIIGDYVDIGSNVCIDRGTIGKTIVGAGTKIDNLVHIAHNVHIGKNCLIMGQSGIAGSTEIGDNVIICGQSGVSDHLKIGKNAIIYAKSAVFSDLAPNKRYSGIPAREHYMVLRALARLYRNL